MSEASITPSEVIQYLYCPRFVFFEKVLSIPQHEENSYKAMRGRHLHDDKLEMNKDYLRKKMGVTNKFQEQYLTNSMMRGKVDEVLELNDGTMAPLDYKFAQYKDKVFTTYKTQLICYAWLIEHNFDKKVNRGYLIYTRSKNKIMEIPITQEDIQSIQKITKSIISIIENNRFPKATTHKKRCLDCTYNKICIQ